MRDIEILSRFLAFRFFATKYPGRMKRFLDDAFETFNKEWELYYPKIERAKEEFESGVAELLDIFGDETARKPNSRQFNRAIFDALIYFQAQAAVRTALRSKRSQLKKAYYKLFTDKSGFLKAIESDTAGAPNTMARLRIWATTISRISGESVRPPKIVTAKSAKAKNSRS
jgi:hypothetical protein